MTIDADEGTSTAERRGAAPARRDAAGFRRIGALSSAKRDPATSETAYFIKTAGTDALQFGEKEYFLWRLLDGSNSVGDIQAKFRARFDMSLTPEQFDAFVEQLVEGGAVERLKPAEGAPPRPGTLPVAAPPEPREPALPLVEQRPRTGGHLFDPSGLLQGLNWLCGPLRFFRWLLLPGLIGILFWATLKAPVIAAGIAAPHAMSAAGVGALALGSLVPALLLGAIVPPLSQAVAASFLGFTTRSCRLAFRGGLVPRLLFDEAPWRAIPSRDVLSVVAAPCLARLVLFMLGTAIGLVAGASHPWVAAPALAVGAVGLTGFLISAAPFLPGQGRRWLTTAFGRDPWRAGGGYRLHAAMLSLLWLAVASGVLLIAADAALPYLQLRRHDSVLGPALKSAALPLLLITPVVARLWISGMLGSYGVLQPSYPFAGGPATALDPAGFVADRAPRPSRAVVDPTAPPPRRQTARPWGSTKTIRIWATILGVIIAVAFVVYPYEAGGYFTILPYDSSQLDAQVQGELSEVLVNEGDVVKPGQILGILSDWQQKYNLALAKAQLESAEANLQNLLHSPTPEAIELARQQYAAATARLPYDKAQFERYAALVINDTVTKANYDQVLSQYQQDQAAAEVARANYDQVRSGPTPDQIEAARAAVRQYTATVAFDEDQLGRTRIRANSYGTVVTPNPMLLRGKWFNQGALVFTVEDHRIVQADVQVPETDIDNVRLGGPVRLRLWGSPERTTIGKTIAVAPDAQGPTAANTQDVQSGSSNVIRVRVEVPNPDGWLHTQTDGYAKMSGIYMPTWRAFGQMLERFFLVEIWSWTP